MPYRVGYPGGAFVSQTPIGRNDYIRPGVNYTPPAGYVAAGRQQPGAASFVDYLHGVAAGRYHAGYENWVNGIGVVKPR